MCSKKSKQIKLCLANRAIKFLDCTRKQTHENTVKEEKKNKSYNFYDLFPCSSSQNAITELKVLIEQLLAMCCVVTKSKPVTKATADEKKKPR